MKFCVSFPSQLALMIAREVIVGILLEGKVYCTPRILRRKIRLFVL